MLNALLLVEEKFTEAGIKPATQELQVWCFMEAMEAIASVAPGLCLDACWNFLIENSS